MDHALRKGLNLSMFVQLVASLFLYLGFITAYRYFPLNEGIAAGLILFLILAIIFWILARAKMETVLTFLPIVEAFDVGLIIGSYFTRFEVSFWPEALYVFAFSFGVVTIVHLILEVISERREFIILCLIGLFAFFLIGLCFMGRSLVMREMIFLSFYHLLTLIGLTIHLFKGEHFGICLSSGFLIAFVVIFIFILFLLGNGNGNGNLDFLDVLGFGKKEKQKSKKEI